jgi:hypothetical protein
MCLPNRYLAMGVHITIDCVGYFLKSGLSHGDGESKTEEIILVSKSKGKAIPVTGREGP